jgi:iron complex outermembrane receptor protein
MGYRSFSFHPMSRRIVPSLAALAIGLSSPVAAQKSGTAETESVFGGEIVVTAQKREQNAQDVGISLTTLSGSQLESLGYETTADIIAQVPSLKMLSFSPSLTIFNLRGVSQNDFSDHYEPPVAVLTDEAYVSTQGAVNSLLFDVERVEVLRGPQGTLFGRNATGGAIQYISRKPTDTLDGYAQLTIGEYDQRNVEAAISGPLTETLSARFAAAYAHNDGWLKNRIGPDINANKDYAGRLFLNWEPSDGVDILLKVHGSRNNDRSGGYSHRAIAPGADGLGETIGPNENPWNTCNGCDILGYRNPSNSPWNQAHDRIGYLKRTIAGATLKATVDLGGVTLTSITDYLYLKKLFGSDSDASPNSLLLYATEQHLDQYSQELRLSADKDGFRWVAGVYLLSIDTRNFQSAPLDTLFTPPFVSAVNYQVKTRSGALFGQAEIDLSDAITLIGGVRGTTDTRKMDFALRDSFGGAFDFNRQLFPDLAKQTFRNISAKGEIDWHVDDDAMIYVSVSRGTKAGGFSAPGFLPFTAQSLVHDQEVLTAYEAGFKTEFFDRKLRLNGSAFHYDYDDYQAFFLVGLSTSIANRDATIDGFELEASANPYPGVDLSAGLSHLDATVKNITLPSGRVVDRKMPMTPGLSLNGLARYAWSALGGTLSVQADANYSSAFNFYVLNPPVTREAPYVVVNGRIGYRSGDGNWELSAQVRNIFNRRYRQYSNDISSLSIGLDAYAPPRWASAALTYRW